MRTKHGHYDEQRHLPNNNGQPVGSGLCIWLNEQVEARWPGLAAESQTHKSRRYIWLIEQLNEMSEPDAQAIVQEYHTRRKAEQREQVQRDRQRHLAQYEKLAQTCDIEQLPYIEKCITKLHRQIAEAEERNSNI